MPPEAALTTPEADALAAGTAPRLAEVGASVDPVVSTPAAGAPAFATPEAAADGADPMLAMPAAEADCVAPVLADPAAGADGVDPVRAGSAAGADGAEPVAEDPAEAVPAFEELAGVAPALAPVPCVLAPTEDAEFALPEEVADGVGAEAGAAPGADAGGKVAQP